MSGLLTVVVLAALFTGSHVWLASRTVRARLVARLGERGFLVSYSAVAATLFALLVNRYAIHRVSGPPGLALGGVPILRWALMTVAVSGIALASAGIMAYPRLPSALFNQPIRSPYGIERISRHPFFAGLALFAGTHVVLATRLVGAVFFVALMLLAIVGARHQDRKLADRRGEAYDTYLAATSFWPFAARLRGGPIVARELPWFALAGGVAVALGLRDVHASLFDHDGAWVIAAVIGGAALALTNAWRRRQRVRATR